MENLSSEVFAVKSGRLESLLTSLSISCCSSEAFKFRKECSLALMIMDAEENVLEKMMGEVVSLKKHYGGF